jgi:hypothetical protein
VVGVLPWYIVVCCLNLQNTIYFLRIFYLGFLFFWVVGERFTGGTVFETAGFLFFPGRERMVHSWGGFLVVVRG